MKNKVQETSLFLQSVYVFICAIALQAILIWALYPSPLDFRATESVTGIYDYRPQYKSVRSFITQDGKQKDIYCVASFVTANGACNFKNQDGQVLNIQLAHIKSLTGEQKVVVRATDTNGAVVYRRIDGQLVEMWQSMSKFMAFIISICIAILFFLIRRYLQKKRKENL